MSLNSATPYIATVILFRRASKVALVLRQNTGWLDNYYGLPGGKVEHGESFLQAAIREAREETGVDLSPQNLKHVFTLHRQDEGNAWVDVIFEAQDWQGELVNSEPHKHSLLDWFDLEALPDNLIPVTRFYLQKIKEGHTYAEYCWD